MAVVRGHPAQLPLVVSELEPTQGGPKSPTIKTQAGNTEQAQMSIVPPLQPERQPHKAAAVHASPAARSAAPAPTGVVTFGSDVAGGNSRKAAAAGTHKAPRGSALVSTHSEMGSFDEQVHAQGQAQYAGGGAGRGAAARQDFKQAAPSVTASTVSVGARLRLGLLGIVTNEVHPITLRVIRVLALMCIVASLVVIVQLSIVAATFERSQRQIGTVLTNERRAGLVVKSTVLVQVAAVSIETGIPVLPGALAQAALLHTADELEAATTLIIEDFDILSSTDIASLEARTVSLQERTASGADQRLNLTLSDACLWFVSHLRRAAPAFLANDLAQTSVTTVLNSGINVLVPALIESGADRIALYSRTVRDNDTNQVNEDIIIFAIVVAVSLAFIWVYMLLLDWHRQEMLGVLKFVPKTTASSMKQAAHNALLARANDEMAADKMDSTAFDGDFTAGSDDDQDAIINTSGNFIGAGGTGQMTARERKFKSSMRRRRYAAGFLSLPVIFVGSMLLTMSFVRQNYRQRIEQSAQRTYLTHRLYQDMFQYTTYSTALISPTVLASLLSASAAVSLEQLDLAFAAQQAGMLDRLEQLLQGTANGPIDGVTTTALDRDSSMGKLLLSDACSSFTPSVPGFGSQDGCRQQRNAVLIEGGLQAGILELVSIVRRGFGSILLAFSPAAVPATLPLLQGTAVQDAATASSLLLPYLSTVTLQATQDQENDLESLGRQEFALLTVTAVLFLLLLLGTVMCIFVPFAKRIGRQATATQVALAMLPPELLQRVPALQAAANAATRKVVIGQTGRDAARRGYVVESLRNG